MLRAMTWLLLFELLGNAIAETLPIPMPGAVIGMTLLLAALIARGGVPDDLRDTGNLLLQNLMLLLVPATAGLMVEFPRLREEWLPICVAVIGGAAITIGVTAVTLRLLIPARSGTP
jgi:holin-like protein